MRWVGIDEAGYGPNLGPLVMSAVVAEGSRESSGNGVASGSSAPDFWADLSGSVGRAGDPSALVRVDDSKLILRRGKGRADLELACLTLLDSIGHSLPKTAVDWFDRLVSGIPSPKDPELSPWIDATTGTPGGKAAEFSNRLDRILAARPFQPLGSGWSVVAARAAVLGPRRFNDRLSRMESKAAVHFSLFSDLMHEVWERAADGVPTVVHGDKHGGRHYYLGVLSAAFPGVWIDRLEETPTRSRYVLRAGNRRVELSLSPRADSACGFVALASMVSKQLREIWMDGFNAFWYAKVPGLRPTAGYPVDAARYRREIEPAALKHGLEPSLWWREK